MPSYPTRLIASPPEDTALKREVMTHFGHICVCPGCGVTELHLLQLDHISGGGNAERRTMKRQGTSFYREVKAAIDRDAPADRAWLVGFQILCQPCNLSKGSGDACTLDHVTPGNDEMPSAHTSLVTPVVNGEQDVLELSDTGSAKDRVTVRLSAADKRWLQKQPDASVSAAVERLIQDRRAGDRTTAAELRIFMAYQREINAQVLTLLSDLALKLSDPDPRVQEEIPEAFSFAHADMRPQPHQQLIPAPIPLVAQRPVPPAPKSWWRKLVG